MRTLDASQTAAAIAAGALLVDIRSPDEHARAHIAGACLRPLDRLQSLPPLAAAPGSVVVFHCRTGLRTTSNAAALDAAVPAGVQACLLAGGLDAWQAAGLPVVVDRTQPLELNRQVQIAVGSLVLLGTVLGTLVWPGFYALPGLLGAGLLFAGLSGICGMARLLQRMPWNRALRG